MRLSELKTGDTGVIVRILGHGAFRKRVIEMGFVKGRPIKVLLHAPLKDPIKYNIMGYDVSLRSSEADMIEVMPLSDDNAAAPSVGSGTVVGESLGREFEQLRHTINVALIGNPNCGKTSLFNIASGAKEHVGNYSGVTVDAKSGTFEHRGYRFNIVDLPGTYSLTSYSPEELYVRDYLRDKTPDVIINVVDASNLERNLYLTTELIDMDHPMVIGLNMYDELRRDGTRLDYSTLGKMIGVPMVPVVARTGEGVGPLFDEVIEVFEERHKAVRHIHVSLGADIENALRQIIDAIKADKDIDRHFSPRYLAIKLLEGDKDAAANIARASGGKEITALSEKLSDELKSVHGDEVSAVIASEKYGFIAGALHETME
ncbi:MAG: 50S ribosome-binding GTPase, partial [Muribaculaceae bacterium]|nr:50S ribosome-binding GTPase [Muribaculaceae bacterium]